MTTAEYIVCNFFDCRIEDINPMFAKMIETGIFREVLDELSFMDVDCIDANFLWSEGIRIALEKVFVDEDFVAENFSINPNCMNSSVGFTGNKDSIEDFESKAEKFKELTGKSL